MKTSEWGMVGRSAQCLCLFILVAAYVLQSRFRWAALQVEITKLLIYNLLKNYKSMILFVSLYLIFIIIPYVIQSWIGKRWKFLKLLIWSNLRIYGVLFCVDVDIGKWADVRNDWIIYPCSYSLLSSDHLALRQKKTRKKC